MQFNHFFRQKITLKIQSGAAGVNCFLNHFTVQKIKKPASKKETGFQGDTSDYFKRVIFLVSM